MTRYLIAIVLPSPVREKIQKLKKHFFPEEKQKVPPHISLSFPFFSPEKPSVEFVKSVEEFAKSTPYLKLKTTSPIIFNQGEKRYFALRVEPAAPVKTLYATIRPVLLSHAAFDTSAFTPQKLPPYLPHITLSICNPTSPLTTNKTGAFPQLKFVVKEISFLEEKKTGLWKTICSFPLKPLPTEP